MIFSAIGFFVWITGTLPTKIELLGVEFSDVDRWPLFVALGVIVLYLLIQFVAARLDWNKRIAPLDQEARELLRNSRLERVELLDQIPNNGRLGYPKLRLARSRAVNSLIRLLETWLPAMFAIATVLALFISAALEIVAGHQGGG